MASQAIIVLLDWFEKIQLERSFALSAPHGSNAQNARFARPTFWLPADFEVMSFSLSASGSGPATVLLDDALEFHKPLERHRERIFQAKGLCL